MKLKIIVIILIHFLYNSCRTVSPIADNTNLNSSHQVKQSALQSKNTKPANIRFFSIKKVSQPETFEITLKSEAEVMCETRCSSFALDQKESKGVIHLSLTKTIIPGNTTPGGYDNKIQIKVSKDGFEKIVLHNFGFNDHLVEVKSIPQTFQQELEYLVTSISSTAAKGGESSGYQIAIDGQFQPASFKSREITNQLATLDFSQSKPVIISGSKGSADGVERGIYSTFEIESIEFMQE